MIRSHAVHSLEPIHEGGSAFAICGKTIVKTHWLAFTEAIPGLPEFQVEIDWKDITCKDCRYVTWPLQGFIYAAIEATEYEQLRAKGRLPDAG